MNARVRNSPEPAARESKAAMARVQKGPSNAKAFLICAIAGSAYLAACAGTLTASSIWLALAFSGFKAFTMAVLFVVGHDACHGGFTPFGRLNQIIARVAFLPTWHPYACWHLGHNRLHHCWTNLKGRDYVWAPLSVTEYQSLSRWRQALQKFYRTLLGLGLYYAVEIWWCHLLFPRREDRAQMRPRLQRSDRALVMAFAVAEVGTAIGVAWLLGRSVWLMIMVNVLVPHVLWNWLMGLVILLHHTHPRVRWYETQAEWSFFRTQVAGTVHVIFPEWLSLLLCNIMEHSAHHVDPKIPLYRLREAQRALETRFAEDVIVTRFRLKDAIEICRLCRLYDFQRKQWLDWHGNPTCPT